jgi:serine O-acetyltransferase
MPNLDLPIAGMDQDGLIQFISTQIANFFPDGRNADNAQSIRRHLPATIARVAPIARQAVHWNPIALDPLSSSQYCQFLYLLAHTIWKETGDEGLPTKLFLLNKALHGIDLFFKVEMPPIFIIGHAVGIVLGRATYGNYFVAFQNSTVGRVGDEIPVIGECVVMFPNSAIVGRSRVGDFTVLSQGSSLVNQDSPGNITYWGQGQTLTSKAGRPPIYRHYFRDVAFL